VRLIELEGFEFDRLNVALLAGGLQAIALELRSHVFGGLAVLRAAGLAALHLVRSQVLDVGPPARAIVGRSRKSNCGGEGDAGGERDAIRKRAHFQ
jgi:hypothetical protein